MELIGAEDSNLELLPNIPKELTFDEGFVIILRNPEYDSVQIQFLNDRFRIM